jgi:hypothetical protein
MGSWSAVLIDELTFLRTASLASCGTGGSPFECCRGKGDAAACLARLVLDEALSALSLDLIFLVSL